MKEANAERPVIAEVERFRDQEPSLLAAVQTFADAVAALEPDPELATAPPAPPALPSALLVGGYVRDLLRGGRPKDADIEVYGVSPKQLDELAVGLFGDKIDYVGRSFGVLKVFVGPGLDLDISIPRRDSKVGTGHKGIKADGDPTMSIREAARRRDFTINSMAMDPMTGVIYDPFEGTEDIERRLLRATDGELFQQDPLRVMRGVQFAARLGYEIEPKTKELLKSMVAEGKLDELPLERMTTEWTKTLLKSERPSVGLELMRELGITKRYYPELHALIDVQQEPEWHPEGDVWVHTLMVVDQAAAIARREGLDEKETLKVIWGAVVHDFGKPSTTEFADGRIRSLGHEEAGVEPATEFFKRLKLPNKITDAAIVMAREHLKPGVFYREFLKWRERDGEEKAERKYANAIRSLLKRLHPISWRVLVAVSEADSRGRTIPGCQTDPYQPGIFLRQMVEKYGLDKESTKPLIQGRDLIELGVRPGESFTDLIRFVESLRDSGAVETREQALVAVQESGLYKMIMLEQARTMGR